MSSEVTVRGIVVPTEWNTEGRVLRVAILTSDEQQYDVADSGPGKHLLGALREEIEACVRIIKGKGCRRTVTVVSYDVVDDKDDDYVLEGLLKEHDRGDW
jgi:hypothetical protein